MRNFVHIDKISQNSSQNVAACIALRNLNLEFYKVNRFPENHIVHETQIFLCLVRPRVAYREYLCPATPMLARIKLNPE